MIKQTQKMALIGLVIILTIAQSIGQATTKEITDKFFSIYSKEPIKAVDYVFSTNKWLARKQDDVANLKNKLKNSLDLCGDYYGYELLSEKTAGQNIKMVTFVVRHDREPIRFTFLFYRPKDNWRLNNFSFDEDIDKDLEEATKAYRLKENIGF